MSNQWLRVLLMAGIVAQAGYAQAGPNFGTLNNQAQAIVKEGQSLIAAGKVQEGVKMLRVVEQVHPDDPTIKAALSKLTPEQAEILKEDTLYGFNRAKVRAQRTPRPIERAFWYIPDRIKDFIDMFTAEVSFGPQLGAGVWATRAVQGVGFIGATTGVGYYQKTLIGGRAESSLDLAIGPVGALGLVGARGGLGGGALTVSGVSMHKPGLELYQQYRDYWALGGKIGFILVGFEAEYHPLEIVDALAGFALIDPLHDDMATTRRLALSGDQKSMMRAFNRMLQKAGKKGRMEYQKQYPQVFASAK